MIEALPRRAGIYRLFHVASGHSYVGSSVNMYLRAASHLCGLNNGTHHSRYLQHAWDKYGQSSFAFEALELVDDRHMLRIREQHWIDTIKPVYNKNPVAAGGTPIGHKPTAETRAKMSAAHKGKPKPAGFGAKVARANQQRKWTAESRAKASEKHKRTPKPWLYGKRPPEVGAKISATKQALRALRTAE